MIKPNNVRERLTASFQRLRTGQRRLRNLSPLELTAYALLVIAIGFLLFPSPWRVTATIFLLTAAFLLIVFGQRRNPTEIELAVLVLVLAQVAGARWSMLLDAEAVRRSAEADARQEQREIRRDSLELARHVRDSIETDRRNLEVVRSALWANHSALLDNEDVLTKELGYLDRRMVSIESTRPLDTGWWNLVIERRPSAIVARDSLLDSLRYVAYLTTTVAAMYADRRNYVITQEGQGMQVQGEPNAFHRRIRKLDNNLLLYSKELRRVIKNLQAHFARDSANHLRRK